MTKVLFICKGNVGRSQVAEAFFNKLSKTGRAISAGSKNYYYRTAWHSKMKKTDYVVRAMADVNIDVSKNRIKKLTRSMVRYSDIIIVLMDKFHAKRDLPNYVKNNEKYRLWEIKDVPGTTSSNSAYKKMRKNRDKIKNLVIKLIKETGNQ